MIRRLGLGLVLPVAMVVSWLPFAQSAAAASPNVAISQIYGGGGNTGAQLGNDFVELVGYECAHFCEGGGPAPTVSNTTAAFRAGGGCLDTDSNSADFVAAPPAPRNAASPAGNCNDAAPSVTATVPASGAAGVAVDASISVTFSEPVNVAGTWFRVVCRTSGGHAATATGGPTTFAIEPGTDFATAETCTVTVLAADV